MPEDVRLKNSVSSFKSLLNYTLLQKVSLQLNNLLPLPSLILTFFFALCSFFLSNTVLLVLCSVSIYVFVACVYYFILFCKALCSCVFGKFYTNTG